MVFETYCFFFLKVKLIMMQRKYGILIPARCTIGEGFFIGHWGTIVVNEKVKIGRNVNISQGVTIGQLNRGKRMGTPVIGNEVYIGPGAKILGNIVVGNNVAIGAMLLFWMMYQIMCVLQEFQQKLCL